MLKRFIAQNQCLLVNTRQVHYARSSLFIPSNANVSSGKKSSKESKTTNLSVSCLIMETNGFLSDTGTGFLTYLPPGKRVVNKLTNLIREEMDTINAQEIEMPALCDLNLWNLTGRNELMGSELFRLEDRHEKKLCLCPTHEEIVTNLVSKYSKLLSSYCFNDSLRLYQITRKYRDESRPKHGLLRSREFLMKDLYTFHINNACAEKTYENVCKAYETVNCLNFIFV
jgi:prolyl-tRNA synthetase